MEKHYTKILIMLIIFSISQSEYIKSQNLDEYLIPRYNTDQIFPQAPNAASFSRYGQYPVDLSSGLVKIEVPIYTIKTQQLEVPITISYHSSGIRVNDIASSIGLGWSLNAGGMITVQIRGTNDFETNPYGPFPTEVELGKLNNDLAKDKLSQMVSGYDSQSDMYSYSAGKISGSFTYDVSGNLIQIIETDNKIEKIEDSNKNFIGFKITSEDGTMYYFTSGGSSIYPITHRGGGQNSHNLSKIVSADSKDSIVFEYEKVTSYTDYSPVFSASKGRHFDPESFTVGAKTVYSGLEISFVNSKVDYYESILTKIKFNGGEVNLNTLEDRKDRVKLRYSGLDVKSTLSNACVFSCNFLHDYFNSEGDQTIKKEHPEYFYRLKLLGIEIKSCIQNELPKSYFFYYNATKLPSYDYSYFYYPANQNGNYPFDLWGYYNNQYNRHLLLPRDTDERYEFEKIARSVPNREVKEEYARACTLEKIVYPTGGSSIFESESNRVGSKLIGGLRIKRISSYDKDDSFLEEKVYKYSGAEEIALTSISGRFSAYNQGYFALDMFSGTLVSFSTLIYTTNIFHFQAVSNSPVFYSNVTEYFGDENKNSGKKEYKYQMVANEGDIKPGTGSELYRYYLTTIDNFWKRGNLLEESVFKKTDNGYDLIERTVNNYKVFKEKKNIVGTIATQSYINLSNHDHSSLAAKDLYHWFDVYASSGVNKLISSTTTKYRNGLIQQVEGVKYNYDKLLSSKNAHTQLTRKAIQTSSKDSIITSYIYPLDIAYSSQSGIDISTIKSFQEKNIINSPIEILSYVKKANNTPLIINGYFFQYKDINQLKTRLKLNTIQSFVYNGTYLVDNKGYNFSDKYETDIIYEYDSQNNIKQYIGRDNIASSILWSYNNLYPVVQVKNAYYQDIEKVLDINSLSKSQAPDISKLKDLLTLLPNALVSIHTYKPLIGLTESIDSKGTLTSYTYDGFGQLIDVKDSKKLVLNRYSYNFSPSDTTNLNCSLITSSQYTQYTSNRFKVSLYNASGTYSYNWTLKDFSTNEVLETGTYAEFSPILKRTGRIALVVTITNTTSKESKTITQVFDVIPPLALNIEKIYPEESAFNFSANITSYVTSSGGSRYFTYKWSLKEVSTGNILASGDKEQISLTLTKAGNMKLYCTLKDIYTKEEKTIEKAFKVNAPPALEWRITPSENQFGLNKNEDFKILLKGGSGNFSYNWTLTDSSNKILSTGSAQTFSFKFIELGKMTLKCKIKDLGAEESIAVQEKTYTFDVISTPPVLIKILPEQLEYKIFERITFNPQIQDGSGNYTYSWSLKNLATNKTNSTGFNTSFTIQFLELGQHELTCLIKDVSKNITITKTYSFNVIPTEVGFSDPSYTTSSNGTELYAESYIYCTEETYIIFNLWINGRFNNSQQAIIWIDNKQFTKDNKCTAEKDGSYKCMNSDESLKLAKGGHSISIRLINLSTTGTTSAGVSIKSVEKGNLGNRTFITISND